MTQWQKQKSQPTEVSLTVAEANSADVGRKVASIDPEVAEILGLSSGDPQATFYSP
ncbi:MAG: hypothetical protein ABI361_04355 [Nitrososphaera sp.]